MPCIVEDAMHANMLYCFVEDVMHGDEIQRASGAIGGPYEPFSFFVGRPRKSGAIIGGSYEPFSFFSNKSW